MCCQICLYRPVALFATMGFLVAQAGAAVIWNAGRVDDLQQYTGSPTNQGPGGGGEDVRFIQEAGGSNALPGVATNLGGEGGTRDIDDDYYFAGEYTMVVDGGSYTPLGSVVANEENMERAFVNNAPGAGDQNLRYHFNFPLTVTGTDLISVNWGITGMENIGAASGWDVELSVNGISIYTQPVPNVANADFSSPAFSLGDINTMAGPGFDNYVQITGTSRVPDDPAVDAAGSRWLSIDYVEMDVSPIPEPTPVGFLALSAIGVALLVRRRGR